jgi:microcystin-dependent protein
MAQIKNWQDGSSGDSWTSTGTITAAGTLAVTGGLTLDGATGTSGQVLVSSGSSATPTWGDAFVTGMIMLWSGSTGSIPSGWALCNGSSGTPDLRNRFVVGAGSTYAVDATGGSANATLPSHTHTFSDVSTSAGSHNHYVVNSNTSSSTFSSNTQTLTWASAGGLGNSDYRGGATNSRANRARSSDVGSHTHTVSGTTSSAGASATNANLPPYYALAYIMKL